MNFAILFLFLSCMVLSAGARANDCSDALIKKHFVDLKEMKINAANENAIAENSHFLHGSSQIPKPKELTIPPHLKGIGPNDVVTVWDEENLYDEENLRFLDRLVKKRDYSITGKIVEYGIDDKYSDRNYLVLELQDGKREVRRWADGYNLLAAKGKRPLWY